MRKYDVTALGELLIDFTENGMSDQGNPLLEANPGGAPCNVLSMLQNLGKKTAFIGKVGADSFGQMLTESVKNQGINTDNLLADKEVHTTLAFVHTDKDGDRSFSFYRNPGADMMLRWNEIDEKIKQYSKKIDLLDKNLFLLNLDINTYNEEIESFVHIIIFEQGHLEYEEIKSIKQYVDQKYRNLIVPSIPDELIFLDNKGFLKYVSIIGNYNSLDSFSIIRYAYLLLDFNAEQMKGFFMNDITQAELFYNE